jgi:hypothetical protein
LEAKPLGVKINQVPTLLLAGNVGEALTKLHQEMAAKHMTKQFTFTRLKRQPILDLSPHHARMAACYRDRKGAYHLLVDFIDASLNSLDSWEAEICYYRSPDLKQWEFVESAVPRGEYRGTPEDSDPDFVGAASPHVLPIGDRLYVFYAGRYRKNAHVPFSAVAGPEDPAYLGCGIMLASAPLDDNGAPIGPFVKQGVIARPWGDWANQRLDDPCAVLDGDVVHLYFKGRTTTHGDVGYARASVRDMQFEVRPDPLLRVQGLGGEAPKVFRYAGKYHMFLHPFDPRGVNEPMWRLQMADRGEADIKPPPASPPLWQHLVSDNGLEWTMLDSELWTFRKYPADIDVIYDMRGGLSDPAYLISATTGHTQKSQGGVIKLYLYKIEAHH